MSQRFLLVLVVIAIFVGCSAKPEPTAPAAVGFQLESVAAGITKLKELNGTIKAAFDAGTPHECDGALHEAAEIVQALSTQAGTEEFSDQKTVDENAKALFDAYMAIHEGFHGHGGAETETTAYDTVAEKIDSAIAALEAAK